MVPPPHSRARLATQIRTLAWRSVLRTVRQPMMIVPSLTFPLFLLAINASGLDAATEIPGFPTDSYLTFMLAFPFAQGAIFATNTAGTTIADDIGSGFFNRLSLTPIRSAALLAGQLAGVLLVGAIQGAVYISVGLLAGADLAAGIGGIPVVFALSLAMAAGFGAVGLFAGIRSGSGEAVQGLFPLMFILLFLSSAVLPRDLIQQDWYATVATWNPVSYLIEAVRSIFVSGWDAEALTLGFAVAASIFALGLAGASIALRERMVRT